MSWRDDLRPGSFRGAAFEVVSNRQTLGRKVAVHEFPLRDESIVEDLGKKVPEYTLTCYVIGENYNDKRDSLITALNKPGAGTLIHPKRGSLLVSVIDADMNESMSEGGKATFSITFKLEGANQLPVAQVDTQEEVQSAATAATVQVQAAFVEDFSVAGLPEFVSESATFNLRDGLGKLREINGVIASATAPLSAFSRDLDAISKEAAQLIRQPATLVSKVLGVFASVANVASSISAAIATYENLASTSTPAAPQFDTPSRKSETKNTVALNQMQAQAASVEASRASSTMSFTSVKQASDVRDRVLVMLDAQMLEANDLVYQAMAELRSKVVADINQRGVNLARVKSHVPNATVPALVLSYQLYGKADREADLITRNDIQHPTFVGGGQRLEVLG